MLALANGAGDVITALVASEAPEGLSYNIGAIYGAGLFVATVVVALTITNSHQVQLEPALVWRDLGCYILATVTVVGFSFIGELSCVSAVVLLSEYALLVVLVLVMERSKASEHTVGSKDDVVLFEEAKKWRQQQQLRQFKHAIHFLVQAKKVKKNQKPDFSELSLPHKAYQLIDAPFAALRWLTLPPCDPQRYTRTHAAVFGPFYMLMLYLFVNWGHYSSWVLVWLACGLLVALLIYLTSTDRLPRYYVLLQVLAAVGGLSWTYLVSGILIDVLQFLAMLTRLPTTYLGLTVIAVGNALPDGITTIALSNQGFAVMGLTGAYAGQLFGLLVGFGLSLLKITITKGP